MMLLLVGDMLLVLRSLSRYLVHNAEIFFSWMMVS